MLFLFMQSDRVSVGCFTSQVKRRTAGQAESIRDAFPWLSCVLSVFMSTPIYLFCKSVAGGGQAWCGNK